MNYRIPLSYNPIDNKRLAEVLSAYAERHHNDLIADFEEALVKVTGASYVVALNSGTAAIHLGLQALGVGPGDEVLVSSFTYVASINPIIYLGARPILIDSEPETWNIDPRLIDQAIRDRLAQGKKPKAIVVVHAYGVPAKLELILSVAKSHGIPVLEDAAEALGSRLNGKHLGTFSEAGVLSFNNNKILTTYGGGALLTNDKRIYDKAMHWASQSREDRPYYQHHEIGYSYRMGPLNAAIGLAELPRLDDFLRARRQIFEIYREHLSDLFEFPKELETSLSNHWLSTAIWRTTHQNEFEAVRDRLKEAGIETRPLWKPMHQQPVFQAFEAYLSGVSEALFGAGLCLPSSNSLGTEMVMGVVDRIIT